MSELREETDVIESSMNVILHAGDARNLICEAGKQIEVFAFEKAEEFLKQAQAELNAAHVLQTGYMQKEASGEKVEYCVLFTHAQDTLMTIISEHNMMTQMLRIARNLVKKMEEGKTNE